MTWPACYIWDVGGATPILSGSQEHRASFFSLTESERFETYSQSR